MIARYFKAKILVFALFFIGIATGVLIANFYTTHVAGARDTTNSQDRAQRAQRDITKFYDYLGLNPTQREEVHKIGEETRREFRELREETQPRYQAIQEKSREKIRALLNDEQRKKYDEFRRKRDDEHRQNHDRDSKNGGAPGPDRW
jgi:hypothetical protein